MNKLGRQASDHIIKSLMAHGFEAFYVGGAVRDYVRGAASSDIDIATSARPEEVERIFERTVDVGIEFGTVLVIVDGEPFEVTTYRHHSPTAKDRLKEDLRRRDFTMNALAYTIDGKLIDFFEGERDIREKQIRAVENPEMRFIEDPLRILRACRFLSTFGYSIEASTKQAIIKTAPHLRGMAPERLKKEFDKLLTGVYVKEALGLIIKTGIQRVLPQFPKRLSLLQQMGSFSTSSEGWAYLFIEGDNQLQEFVKAYALSNDEKSFIQAVQQAFNKGLEQSFTRSEMYQYEAAVLSFVDQLYGAKYNRPVEKTIEDWQMEKAKLPIQSKKDLAVTGKDLMEWLGIQQGPWVGDWMTRIEQAVLHEHIPNKQQAIKEWFIREFNTER